MKHVIAALSLAAFSGLAFSQPSAPADKSTGDASRPPASASGTQQGMGPGAGGGMGPRGRMMRFDKSNTPGWSLMTPEERIEHRNRMHSFKTVDECKAYHDEHVKKMQDRAKEKGTSFKPLRGDPCTAMQRRGFLQ